MKGLIKRILREEYVDNTFNPYNEDYLDAWLNVGDEDMESYYEYGVNGFIPKIIEEVKELKFPLRIYRGLWLHPKDKNQKHDLVSHPHYDNTSWTTELSVAKKFGNVIYTGIVESMEDVNLKYTIHRRILHKPLDEYEIVLKNNDLIKGIKKGS
jgi:hypothetical protein